MWEGLANGEVNHATSDLFLGIAFWYDALIFSKRYIPVSGAIACSAERGQVINFAMLLKQST